jgi:hypothetical protein
MSIADTSPESQPPETDTPQAAPRQQDGHGFRVSFLGFDGHLPRAVAMLFAAVAGALLIAIPGIGRTTRLRRVALRRRTAEPSDSSHMDAPSATSRITRARRWHPQGGTS